MSGLVSGLQNRVRRFESARNLNRPFQMISERVFLLKQVKMFPLCSRLFQLFLIVHLYYPVSAGGGFSRRKQYLITLVLPASHVRTHTYNGSDSLGLFAHVCVWIVTFVPQDCVKVCDSSYRLSNYDQFFSCVYAHTYVDTSFNSLYCAYIPIH